ncbi:hypothetical protein [Xylanibacter ruminicola]|uniref:Uncharacterized protein n=1 Tax=Xylanibacter ruminicola TaxID=839 RepID=A0A1M6XST8_XYLRU|nr:hypothetical protein [Xylanibacter ruminicola]SHL08875.1 hypothetical protein SAMN05216463_1221 [Xylanibacter ruminicola]
MEPAWEKVQGLKFQLLQKTYNLPNGGKKLMPYYQLTKTETLYIATKFNDEARAKQFSIALKGAGVTRNSVQQMLKNWRRQERTRQMLGGQYKRFCIRNVLKVWFGLKPPSLYPRKHRELLRAIVAVSLGISLRKVDLKALDAAYSVAFPNSTPLNINKKKRKK